MDDIRKIEEQHDDDPLGLNGTYAWMTALDEERGKADPDDMGWYREERTTLDENVRVSVYDWDADAVDVEVMTRRVAIIEGYIQPYEDEVELLRAEGVTLPESVKAIQRPAPAMPTLSVEPGEMTLAELIRKYGENFSDLNVTLKTTGMRIVRATSISPIAVEIILVTRSGKEVRNKSLPEAHVIVH